MLWIASQRADWQAKNQEIAQVALPVCADCPGCHNRMGLLELGEMYVPCWASLLSETIYHTCERCTPHVHLDPVLRN